MHLRAPMQTNLDPVSIGGCNAFFSVCGDTPSVSRSSRSVVSSFGYYISFSRAEKCAAPRFNISRSVSWMYAACRSQKCQLTFRVQRSMQRCRTSVYRECSLIRWTIRDSLFVMVYYQELSVRVVRGPSLGGCSTVC